MKVFKKVLNFATICVAICLAIEAVRISSSIAPSSENLVDALRRLLWNSWFIFNIVVGVVIVASRATRRSIRSSRFWVECAMLAFLFVFVVSWKQTPEVTSEKYYSEPVDDYRY